MISARKLRITSLAGMLLSGLLHAQQPVSLPSTSVPRLVNFSGKAVDAQGKTITGIAGVTFAIYAEQSGSAPLWMETQNVQADTKGAYVVQLGATKPGGLPLDLFTSGAARWLGVTVNGGEEQPRILLLSVPYALKAEDAETVGGLPASAFMLAAQVAGSAAASPGAGVASPAAGVPPPATSNVITNGGTINAIPLWSTATDIQNSVLTQTGSGTTARIGVNTTAPATTLDVNGAGTVRGALTLPAIAAATATKGANSQPQDLVASSFSSSTSSAVNQKFQWQAEPVNNNTANPAATLNLLYGSGTTAPGETGLKIGPRGVISFVPGQTFPGSTVTGNETVQGNVVASGQLISTIAIGTPPLKVTSTTQVPNLNASFLGGKQASAFATIGSNTFVGNQSITGSVGIGTVTPAQALDINNGSMVVRVDPGNDTTAADGGYALVGRGTGGVPNTWWAFTAPVGGGFGVPVNSYSIWQYPPNSVPGCCLNRFNILPAETSTDTGATVTIDQNGNADQSRTAGGWVKAMLFFSPFNGGRIVNCFNSTLSGAAATAPPCGFTIIEKFVGDYVLDLGFQIDDRFLSATVNQSALTAGACTDISGCNNSASLTPNRVELTVFAPVTQTYYDDKIYLVVY
jgi:hypothetical protein